MKKFSKIGKRVLAFFLVALMNINSYAAVGANDGSAFVTKAEFDALVNTFNEQMDSYESSLVTKIDGAIANYLASISNYRVVAQNMLINNLNYPFINGWSFIWDDKTTTSSLGNKLRYCLFLVATGSDQYQRRDKGGSGYSYYEWKVGTDNSDYAIYRTQGDKNSYYVIYKDSTYDEDYVSIVGAMSSYMDSAYVGIYHTGAQSWANTTIGSVNQDVVVDTADTWRSQLQTKSGTVFGRSVSVNGIKNFQNVDTITTPDCLKFVSGSVVPTDKLYCVKDTELTKKMTSYSSSNVGACNTSWFRCQWDDGGNSVNKADNTLAAKYKIAGYYHKYDEVASGKGFAFFVNDAVSSAAGELAGYYNGLPLFTASEDGRATLELKFSNNKTGNSNFQIKNGKFNNEEITAGVAKLDNAECYYVDEQGNVIRNVYTIPSGRPLTVSFDAKAKETYWIKVMPVTDGSYTRVTADSMQIVVE